jgi:predicted O-methyltransferase YrrM
MEGKARFTGRDELLTHAVSNITVDGLALEFGVFSGHSINHIASALPDRTIYGFDSFQGLPESWTSTTATGHFAQDFLPPVRENVELIVGWFDRTLPGFLDTHPEKVAFLHVDCDLYLSTQTVLAQLRDRIVPGTITVFDEYFNYPGWKRHEFQAFQEFVKHRRIRYEYIGLVPSFEQVAVRILG